MSEFWRPGDRALLRYRRLGLVSWVFPVTVVEDGPDLTALYIRPGTPTKRRTTPDGTPFPHDLPYVQRAKLPHRVGDGVWHSHHALVLVRPGEAHDVRLFWTEGWEFRGWYVNLQQPVRRSAVGFDSVDHIVDIVVGPDGSWSWKDENEFAQALAIGRFDPGEVQAIRNEGQRAIRDIEGRRWPFDGSWLDWRPDPTWPVPAMPPNWDDERR
ncbi:MAG TPA: DUF402 domain-containing protein [Thermomicrobiales bacterium]|nr:DUF402 domain-containing protein [Thermomicrobiales bacterium]